MKQYLSIFLVALMVTVLSVPISADFALSRSFEDNCSSLEENSYRTTANLTLANSYLQQVDFPAMTDKTGFELRDFSNPGEVIYFVENPRSVSVSLYRSLPSFAVLYSDGTLAYDVLPDSSEEFQLLPLWVGVEDGLIYCFTNGNYHQLYYNEGEYAFREVEEPAGGVHLYGLSIQASSDGATFDTLEAERTYSAHYTAPDSSSIFDETFHADLPANCRYLKIQAEQYPCLPYIEDGFETIIDTASWYKVVIRHVSYSAALGKDEDWSGAPLPDGMIGDTSYGEKDSDSNGKSPKSQSSKESKSSSGKSPDIKNSTSTSSRVENSTSSTTTDSNNSTTSYTTNYYFYNFSEEAAEAIEQILTSKQPPDLSELKEKAAAKEEQSNPELPLETVVMEDTVSPEQVGSAVSPSTLTISPESGEGSHGSQPIFIYVGMSLIILFQIILILRRPPSPLWSSSLSEKDDEDEDGDEEE